MRPVTLLACCRCAFGLNDSLDNSQYAHTAWTVRDAFFKGAVTSIAQTPDGYLWLGTDYYASMAFRGSHGRRRRVSIFPTACFEAC